MVSKDDVVKIQSQWGDGVVKIGSLKDDKDTCAKFASEFLDTMYAFDAGPVLFKPTKCAEEQFRNNKDAAMSYFIAGDHRICDEDKGFAVTPWTKVRFENSDLILEENRAIAMGNYFFTDVSGGETKVEYTFGYKKVNGKLKIDLHHSSLPYNP